MPGWVRVLQWLRAALHTKMAERELLKAALDIERLYAEGLFTSGSAASSFGPRELERAVARVAGNDEAIDRVVASLDAEAARDGAWEFACSSKRG